MRWKSLILGFLLLTASLGCGTSIAGTQTLNPLPDARQADFNTKLQTFLANEDAQRYNQQFSGFIATGGTASPSPNLNHTIASVVGYPSGYYVNQGARSHTYTSNRRTYVYLHKDDTTPASFAISGGTGCTFSARDQHFLFVECASNSTEPTTPVDSVRVLYADTDGSTIANVVDLRQKLPMRASTMGLGYSLAEFGVVCDGSTTTGPALQFAIDSVPDGATLFIPVGTCVIGTNPINVNKSLTFLGQGRDASIFTYATAAGGPAFNVTANFTYFKHLTLNGQNNVQPNVAGFLFTNVDNIGLEDVHVEGFRGVTPTWGRGVDCFSSGVGGRCYFLHVKDSKIRENGYGILMRDDNNSFPPTYPVIVNTQVVSNLSHGFYASDTALGLVIIGGQYAFNGGYGINTRGQQTTIISPNLEGNATSPLDLSLRDCGLGSVCDAFLSGILATSVFVDSGSDRGRWHIIATSSGPSNYLYGDLEIKDDGALLAQNNVAAVASYIGVNKRTLLSRSNTTQVSIGDTTDWTAVRIIPGQTTSLQGAYTFDANGLLWRARTFAALGAPADNGYMIYCSDCTRGSSPCTAGGTGAMAQRLAGVWHCD